MASAGFELFLIPSAGLLSFIGASTGVLAVTILAYTSWKSLESARVRQIVRNDAGGTLPMPAPLLPKWCGFVGGHTLLIKPSKVFTSSAGQIPTTQNLYQKYIRYNSRVLLIVLSQYVELCIYNEYY